MNDIHKLDEQGEMKMHIFTLPFYDDEQMQPLDYAGELDFIRDMVSPEHMDALAALSVHLPGVVRALAQIKMMETAILEHAERNPDADMSLHRELLMSSETARADLGGRPAPRPAAIWEPKKKHPSWWIESDEEQQ